MKYIMQVTADSNDTYLVTFPAIPFAHTVSDSVTPPYGVVLDALITAFEIYTSQRKPIPMPPKVKKVQATDQVFVMPLLVTIKVLLWNEMLAQRLRKSDLSERLYAFPVAIDRLFDFRHATQIDFMERAARALNSKFTIALV